MSARPTSLRLAAYGALGLPLAMAALPIYVHVPKFYADTLGLSLAGVGAILVAARIVDAVQDPFFGWWSDRARAREVLARLETLLAEDDTQAYGVWLESADLIEAALGSAASQLRDEIDRFEYDKALRTLRGELESNGWRED